MIGLIELLIGWLVGWLIDGFVDQLAQIAVTQFHSSTVPVPVLLKWNSASNSLSANNETDPLVDILLKAESIQPKYVNQINIFGNSRTLDKVIRREVVFAEGDAINSDLIRITKRNLDSLGIFKSVKKEITEGSSDKTKTINITVEEQATGEISAGAGAGTSGQTVSFGVRENNYLGTGVKLDTSLSVSDTGIDGIFTINNPNYKNSNKSLIASLEAKTVPPVAIKDLFTTLSTSGKPIFFIIFLSKVLFFIFLI